MSASSALGTRPSLFVRRRHSRRCGSIAGTALVRLSRGLRSPSRDRSVDTRIRVLPAVGDAEVVAARIHNPKVGLAPGSFGYVFSQWPAGVQDSHAFLVDVIDLEHELDPNWRLARTGVALEVGVGPRRFEPDRVADSDMARLCLARPSRSRIRELGRRIRPRPRGRRGRSPSEMSSTSVHCHIPSLDLAVPMGHPSLGRVAAVACGLDVPRHSSLRVARVVDVAQRLMGRADVVDLFDDLAQPRPGADVGKSGSQFGGAGVCPRVRPDRPGRPDRRRQPIRRDGVVGRGCGVSGALTAGQQEVCRKDRGAQRVSHP